MKIENKMIGSYLGTIEEFLPGDGTYAEDGKIYASNIGKVILNRENHIAKVDGKFPPRLKNDQIVFGEVLNIKKNSVTVIVRKLKGFKGEIDVRTELFVSNISDEYIEKPEDVFAIGDIVKAKVIKIMIGMVDISTKGNLGVVKAFCKRCRSSLLKSSESPILLFCPSCGNKEKRKIAPDYGNVAEI